ncbi:YIP1 family protein [Cohnella hongkongensis]|uniref:YIP1 family protein n=1 Tax=Cohnella hongkongensis TaxID=178337 RepID=A0ABV9FFR3_9BACL
MIRYSIACLLFIVLLVSFEVPEVKAEGPYKGYNYSYWGEPAPAPLAYVPERAISGEQLGIGGFKNPQDVFVAADGYVYILDSGNGRIVVLDPELSYAEQFQGFMREGRHESFNKPQGLFVTSEGAIYVADTENGRVVELDADGGFVREIGAPEADVLTEGFRFFPQKIVLDKAKRIYVAGRGVFDGIIQFSAGGEFETFLGANRVRFNPIDYFWKSVSTKAQRAQMVQFVPIEYNNFDIDDAGFIYATSAGERSDAPIKRLNPSGQEVLRRQGYFPILGDLAYPPAGEQSGPSRFIDVDVPGNGMYSVLDGKRGRVFTYDEDGNLLYIYGLLGNQVGTFKNPVAIEHAGDRPLVLDGSLNQLTVFRPTRFGTLINEAAAFHYAGDEVRSAERWQEVVQLDANFEIAYIGIGKALLRQGENKEAARYFKLGMSRTNYSKAYQRYRQEVLERNFGSVMAGLVVAAAAAIAVSATVKRRRRRSPESREYVRERGAVAFVFRLMFHPFEGFWELKYERKAKMSIAMAILFLVIVAMALQAQYAGFVVNDNNPLKLNSLDQVQYVLLPFFLWCIANWSLTTLMDGEGKFKEIVLAAAYALTPIVLIYVPTTIWSHFMTLEESAFYYLLNSIAIIWFLFLFFVGTMTVHQYTVTKTIVTIFLTILAMGFIVFLAMLFFSLLQQIYSFAHTIYIEFVYRT